MPKEGAMIASTYSEPHSTELPLTISLLREYTNPTEIVEAQARTEICKVLSLWWMSVFCFYHLFYIIPREYYTEWHEPSQSDGYSKNNRQTTSMSAHDTVLGHTISYGI